MGLYQNYVGDETDIIEANHDSFVVGFWQKDYNGFYHLHMEPTRDPTTFPSRNLTTFPTLGFASSIDTTAINTLKTVTLYLLFVLGSAHQLHCLCTLET